MKQHLPVGRFLKFIICKEKYINSEVRGNARTLQIDPLDFSVFTLTIKEYCQAKTLLPMQFIVRGYTRALQPQTYNTFIENDVQHQKVLLNSLKWTRGNCGNRFYSFHSFFKTKLHHSLSFRYIWSCVRIVQFILLMFVKFCYVCWDTPLYKLYSLMDRCRHKGQGFWAFLVWNWGWFSRELQERINVVIVSIPNE